MNIYKCLIFLTVFIVVLPTPGGCYSSGKAAADTETYSSTENTDENIIFIGDKVNIYGGYSEETYAVSFEAAAANITETDAVSPDTNFLCYGTAVLKDDIYYVIGAGCNNGSSFVSENTFWVNTESGEVYAYLDPMLPAGGYLAEFKDQIENDDLRSRLIKISE